VSPWDDGDLCARLREPAAQQRRFGYSRLHELLRRGGTRLNYKKLRRPYREQRLQVRGRGGRERALAAADRATEGAKSALVDGFPERRDDR
jgi:hypothetical protein